MTGTLNAPVEFTDAALTALAQEWIDTPASNHGFMIMASEADEQATGDNRKVLCGKGFPLETSTDLSQAEALSHRPRMLVEYHLP